MHIGTHLTRESARLQDGSRLGATAATPYLKVTQLGSLLSAKLFWPFF